jgi:hypothetical protein
MIPMVPMVLPKVESRVPGGMFSTMFSPMLADALRFSLLFFDLLSVSLICRYLFLDFSEACARRRPISAVLSTRVDSDIKA